LSEKFIVSLLSFLTNKIVIIPSRFLAFQSHTATTLHHIDINVEVTKVFECAKVCWHMGDRKHTHKLKLLYKWK